MERAKNRRLVVVLGAPRSGFTAVASVLDSLGVRFEANELPKAADAAPSLTESSESEINRLLLSRLGFDRDRLGLPSTRTSSDPTISRLRVKAFQLASRMTEDGRIGGFKDPSTSRLLDFWKTVFSAMTGQVSFILAVRNPASVAASLGARDAIPAQKAYLLWLQHVLPSILLTRGARRIVVDYDQLLRDPRGQIARLSAVLGLPLVDAAPSRLADLESSLLESGRRHAHFSECDLAADHRALNLVAPVHGMLERLATDQESLENPDVHAAFAGWSESLALLAPAFEYINALENAGTHIARRGAEHAEEAGRFDQRLAVLNDALVERDQHIGSLGSSLSSLRSTLSNLTADNARRQDQIDRLAGEIAALKSTLSWRVTRPLRKVKGLSRGDGGVPTSSDEGSASELWAPPVPERGSDPVELTAEPPPVSALDLVPAGFDPQLYLDLYPDLSGSHELAAIHYLRHGKREGRVFSFPEIDAMDEGAFQAGRETILVVSHEASRTGAPVLSLNLVTANVERYNVVALILGGGPLEDAFRQTGAAVMISPSLRGNPVASLVVLRRLHERFDFKFALVNSIESRAVLPALGRLHIPAVTLLHEFAAYTRPATAFREAFFWSTEVVFSTNVTLENARAEHPALSGRAVHVLPQGRCLLPAEGVTENQLRTEQARIRRLMRPRGAEDKAVVVLGAGTVQMRKGVDLFVQCAARARQAAPEIEFRFVWIGGGYDPVRDTGYSVYVFDQIRRAGLEKHIVFIDESFALETAYETADLFLLSSRLDPLPNVAIEAMAFGLPVICFDRTTGIVDFLNDAGLGPGCVAEFLDSADMAEKLTALASSGTLRDEVGARSRAAAESYFSGPKYFDAIASVASSARARVRQEKEDGAVILDSGLFRPDFATPLHLTKSSADQSLRNYVRGWASGIDRRKPFPGFHPGVYEERHGLASAGSDPFVDYLRAGRPEGPWHDLVLSGDAKEPTEAPNARVALHVHVHYPELVPDILARLARNRTLPDLFVSVTSEKVQAAAAGHLESYAGRVAGLEVVPNRGRDIGPFLTAFGRRLVADYDYVGHIHTKKTVASGDPAMGEAWRRFLLENLIGGESGSMIDRIMAAMSEDASIGMVFPDDPHVVGWGANRTIALDLASRMGVESLPEQWNFPVGTMFWAQSRALAPVIGLGLGWNDYPEEPLADDGTLLHAIERLLPLTLPPGRLRIAVTNVPGCTR